MRTKAGDLLLIHHNHKPVAYARVEEITADVKQDWWQITLMLLQVPAKRVTWILRSEYIDGDQFTMGGEPMRMEPVPPVAASPAPREQPLSAGETGEGGQAEDKDPPTPSKVVSLEERRRR